jgi:hypothetical protein
VPDAGEGHVQVGMKDELTDYASLVGALVKTLNLVSIPVILAVTTGRSELEIDSCARSRWLR